jgi:hypothetical protein
VLVPTKVNVNSLERSASLVLGSAFAAMAVWPAARPRSSISRLACGLSAFAFFRRAFTGHSRVYSALGFATRLPTFVPLESSSAQAVPYLQRTVTILASLAEVELFFLDPPRLGGFELGRDLEIDFTFAPRSSGVETELRGRLVRWPSVLGRDQADRVLREFLRQAKQLIEAGEVAQTDERVRGHA